MTQLGAVRHGFRTNLLTINYTPLARRLSANGFLSVFFAPFPSSPFQAALWHGERQNSYLCSVLTLPYRNGSFKLSFQTYHIDVATNCWSVEHKNTGSHVLPNGQLV